MTPIKQHEIHEHLEIDHGSITTYVNVFGEQDYTHMIIGRTDNEGLHIHNKMEFFFEDEQLDELLYFFTELSKKVRAKRTQDQLTDVVKQWVATDGTV